MGYYGKLFEKSEVQKLRKQGLSYRAIQKVIPVSKDSISRWCRSIPLTDSQSKKLENNKRESVYKASSIAASNKRKKKEDEIKMFMNEGSLSVGNLSERDRFIAGIVFYQAEGTKFDGKCEFTNADARLIVFMMEWFREFFIIPLEKFRGAIWLHDDLNESQAKEYWSQLTNIPIAQFHKTYVVKKKFPIQIRKQLHPYGVFSIRFSDTKIHRKIIGLISGILKNYVV